MQLETTTNLHTIFPAKSKGSTTVIWPILANVPQVVPSTILVQHAHIIPKVRVSILEIMWHGHILLLTFH